MYVLDPGCSDALRTRFIENWCKVLQTREHSKPLRCKGFCLVLRGAGISLGESSGRADLLRALYEQVPESGVISDDNVDMAWAQVWTLSSQPLSPEVRQ